MAGSGGLRDIALCIGERGLGLVCRFFFEPNRDARVAGAEGEGEVVYGEDLSGKVKGTF